MKYVTHQCLTFSSPKQVCLAIILRMCIQEFPIQIPAIFMINTQHDKLSHIFDKICDTSRHLVQQQKFTVSTEARKKKLRHAQFVIL